MNSRLPLPGKHTTARRDLARYLRQHRHGADKWTLFARWQSLDGQEASGTTTPARAEPQTAAAGGGVTARPSGEQEFLDGMKPGDSPTTALDVLEKHAKQPYKTVWLTPSWWPQRREALLQLLSDRLTHEEALALSDFSFRKVGFDVLFAFLSKEQPRP